MVGASQPFGKAAQRPSATAGVLGPRSSVLRTGVVAQLGERRLCTAEVRGSTPRGSTGRAAETVLPPRGWGRHVDKVRRGTPWCPRVATRAPVVGGLAARTTKDRPAWPGAVCTHMTKMSTWGMPRRQRPTKDAPTRRNALGTCWERVSQRSPNGATRPGSYRDTGENADASPRGQGAPGELKHLSTPRRRQEARSSGERNGQSPNRAGGTGCRRCPSGVGRLGGTVRQDRRLAFAGQPKAAGTGHRSG